MFSSCVHMGKWLALMVKIWNAFILQIQELARGAKNAMSLAQVFFPFHFFQYYINIVVLYYDIK